MKTWHYEVLIAILLGLVIYLVLAVWPIGQGQKDFRGPTGAPHVEGPTGPPPQ
jgi:hypothetical protein